ncbi:MAG: dihydrodipicolinate synthase family protein [Thermoplasmatales archaeon]
MSKFRGAFAEIFLALKDDGTPDLEKTKSHVRYLIDKGVKGLFVGGIAAEGFTFNREEKMKWLSAAIEEAGSKVPVIFNISSINVNEVIEIAREAVDMGADSISVTQPTPVSFSESEILRYYEKISFINEDLMLYNENAIGNTLKIDTVKKIFSSFENFKYYKDSTHNMIDLHSLFSAERHPAVFAGSDALIYDIMASGGSGVISLVVDVFPDLINGIVSSLENGNFRKALEQQTFILKVRSILKKGGLTAGYRFASHLIGIDLGNPRIPYSSLSDVDKREIEKELAALKLI